MIGNTWIRITLAISFLLAADTLLIGWLVNGWLEAISENGDAGAPARQALPLTLLANFILLGAGIALLLRRYVGRPLRNLRAGLTAFHAAHENRFAGLIPVTRRPSDLNEIGLRLNALMHQLRDQPYHTAAVAGERESREHHRSYRQSAD